MQEEKILYEAKKTSFSVMNANSVISLINLLIKLCLYSLSAVMVWENTMSVGVLTVILTFYGYLTRNVSSVSQRYLDSENRISYIQKIYDFLHTPTEKVWDGKDNLQVSKGKIEISNLYFSYNDQSITLKNINLISFPGESIALVGKSGCGKTTLAFLMLGFYKLQKGKILIDGKSLNECSLKSIRNQIGLVQQNVLIFSGSIRQNLLLGNIHATEREIWDACKAAGIEELIHSFPRKIRYGSR
ncbi:ATP-binding cassette domain-containing protein [Sellimonas intestinalis]|uniref:ATP-binding cassette domain-containing protein n=1 Tax=Sellimonas intestinalis TaxID=1653434 RepID=UPI0039A13CA8